ncbi:Gfo/Idh/MocA family protein [Sphingobacterium bovistauri]|uniref:Gfo/Idh/MocA family oxidoreductase n=1 Tax=Sphingobacterium bovistauri TaxID=2781959 RepID=A0ABS7Z9E6_9SPHI|nr:Gfo/Idh/MocA family oxidoreductase [Sphingobacterium bovistauri]MCA5005574.1 Gfo/Idh/MocA family oxidoreductase [Sphingobacterium bovistauri]
MINYTRRDFIGASALALGGLISNEAFAFLSSNNKKRIGIIGLDTSHSLAFTKTLFQESERFRGFKVVAAYPFGTKTIPSATSRIPQYTTDIKQYDVEIVDSIKSLLKKVDFILLETNDGRLHLEQAREVFKAKKPLFIDKPLAASYRDAAEIFALSKKYNVPFFSTSSLRYIEGLQDVIAGKYGKVLGADVYSPAAIDPSHPDFFWYGIHAVEMLFAAMGLGCQSVSRTHTQDADILVGVWNDGRIGTVRGTRSGQAEFGGVIHCEKATVKLGKFEGYSLLLDEIVKFFDTKNIPFDGQETLEICAFIEAADLSKANSGQKINLAAVTNF